MSFRTTLFLFVSIPSVLLGQFEDSIITNYAKITYDSSTVSAVDSLEYASDSVYNEVVDYAADSSTVSYADSVGSIIDSLDTRSAEVRTYLYQQPFSNQSTFITKSDILRNDYRYAGDFLKHFSFSFERSYGFIGHPNDIYLYGEGSSSTSYFIDGLPFRITDFNQIQSEDIDSIEIVPLPRGFLYGFTTNPVSVNFISKDIIPTKPYSRIKYYEGPFGEAFIDGIFSMHLFKDIIASVDITNRKVDDSFKNSAFSTWQAKAKLRYNLSDKINLTGSYYFSKSTTGINGGVNVDKIKLTTNDVNSILYNETLAPVYYENISLDFKQHNFGLKILAEPFENAITDLNFYYKFYLKERNSINTEMITKSTFKDKVMGLQIDQRITMEFCNISLKTGYQYLSEEPTYFQSNPKYPNLIYYDPYDYRYFFITPEITITYFNKFLTPSIYFKYSNTSRILMPINYEIKKDINGYGVDLKVALIDQMKLYLGYSSFIDNSFYYSDERISTFESILTYNFESSWITCWFFNKKNVRTNLFGLGLKGSLNFYRISLEAAFAQYLIDKNSVYSYIKIPESQFNCGFYYHDILFKNNLDLKSGLKLNYFGRQDLFYQSHPSSGNYFPDIPSALTLDFTVSAEIQKTALVYFTWENLLDKKYYITPYYPMLERNIRFGVAWELFN